MKRATLIYRVCQLIMALLIITRTCMFEKKIVAKKDGRWRKESIRDPDDDGGGGDDGSGLWYLIEGTVYLQHILVSGLEHGA